LANEQISIKHLLTNEKNKPNQTLLENLTNNLVKQSDMADKSSDDNIYSANQNILSVFTK
jgi:hypothetical protein